MIWGGQEGCEHEWHKSSPRFRDNRNGISSALGEGKRFTENLRGEARGGKRLQEGTCVKCGAWRGALGLEKEVDCLSWARSEPPCNACYVCHLRSVLQEMKRVLRKDGIIFINLGDSYVSAKSRYSSKRQTISGKERGEPTDGRKPDLYRYPVLKDKDLALIPQSVALAARADGLYVRSWIDWVKQVFVYREMTTWGNGMPESVKDRPSQMTETILMLTQSPRYFYDRMGFSLRPKFVEVWSRKGGGMGTPYEKNNPRRRKLTKHDLATGRAGHFLYSDPLHEKQLAPEGKNLGNAWLIGTVPFSGAHFAVMPPTIPEICIRLATSKAGECARCGKAFVREVAPNGVVLGARSCQQGNKVKMFDVSPTSSLKTGVTRSFETVGWRPQCRCYGKPVRSKVECKRCEGGGRDVNYLPQSEKDALIDQPGSPLFRGGSRDTGLRKVETDGPCPECDGAGVVDGVVWELDVLRKWERRPQLVLDPFSGSGTVVVVAKELGRRGIGCDLSFAYSQMAKKRIGAVSGTLDFVQIVTKGMGRSPGKRLGSVFAPARL